MARDNRKVDAKLMQEVPLHDPNFLREIVVGVMPQVGEAGR